MLDRVWRMECMSQNTLQITCSMFTVHLIRTKVCSVSCGGTGSKSRTKDCIAPANGGLPCPEEYTIGETAACDAPACWTAYGEWSDCTGECDTTGSRSQTRTCIPPTDGGQPCPDVAEETKFEECPTEPCWTEFGEWSTCSLTW